MKNVLILMVLVFVAFVSCDGRKSKSVSLKESIEEFNEKQSETILVNYYPKEYTEVITDTIISNEVKVHIKNYSLPNKSIRLSTNEHNQKEHRVFQSEIVISMPKKQILSTLISAEVFKTKFTDNFWNHVTLQHVWVNQELSTSKDVKLDMSFINPIDDSYKLYRMSIDNNGQQQIELIEDRT